MIVLAVVVFLIEAFIVYNLGYAKGLLNGASSIASGLKKILSPEEFKELDEKVQKGLLKIYGSKN